MMDDKENQLISSKTMKDITNVSKRDLLGATDLKTENAKMRKALQEKEKELVLLNRQFLIQADTIKDLQNKQDKAKHSELEAKKKLSSNLTSFRRQSIDLKRINENIQSVLKRDEDKVRRSKLERKELEDEINRMEEDFEQSIATIHEEMKAEKEKYEGLLDQKVQEFTNTATTMTLDFETALNEAKNESCFIKQEFEVEKEKMTMMLRSIQDELQSEKVRMNVEKSKLDEILLMREKQHNEEIIRLSFQLKAEKETIEDLMTSKEQQYIDDSSAKTAQYFESIQKFSSQLNELNNKLVSLVADNNTLKISNEKLSNDIESLMLSLEIKDDEIKELVGLTDKLQSNLKKSENEISRRTESFNQIRSNLYEAESKISAIQKGHKGEMEKLVEEHDEMNAESARQVAQEKAELKEKNLALSQELQCAITEMNRMAEEHHIQSLVVAGLSNDLQAAINREKEYKANVAELETQIKGLVDESAAKDKNYETLLEEASVIENTLVLTKQEYEQLVILNENTKDELRNAAERCQCLENDINQHLDIIKGLNEEAQKLSQIVINHEATIANAETKYSNLESNYIEFQSSTNIELSELKDTIQSFKDQRDVPSEVLKKRIELLTTENASKEKEVQSLQGKLTHLQNHFNTFKQHSENTQILIVSLKNESNVFKTDLESTRRELKLLKEERNNTVESLNTQLKSLNDEIADKTKKYELVMKEKGKTSSTISNLQNEHNDTITVKDKEIHSLKVMYDDILEQVAKKDKIIEFLQSHVADNSAEAVTALEHQVKLYKAELDQIQGHANGKQKIMYLSALKQQINDLLAENSKLRKRVSVDN